MSFDDYANHIYEKHRLATALAIIKSKPKNITTTEYLDKLKSDFGKMNDNDDDETVCSDDFLMDDDDMNDSVTILKDFDDEIIGHQVGGGDDGQPIQTSENNSQTTFYESSQSTAENIAKNNSDTVKNTETNDKVQKNVVIQDRNEPKELNTNISTNLDLNTEIQLGQRHQNNSGDKTINKNTNATFFDSQETQIYTVYGFSQNYTHYSQSQSQTNVSIPKQYLYKSITPSETKILNANNVQSKDKIVINRINENNSNNCTPFDDNNTITRQTINNTGKTNNIDKDLNSNKVISQENNNILILNENNKDIDINKEVIVNNQSQYSQSIDDYFYEMQSFHDNNATSMDIDTEIVAENPVSNVTIANTEKYNENTEFNNANLCQFRGLTEINERNTYTNVISNKNNDDFGQKNTNLLQNKDLTECVNANTLQNRDFTEDTPKDTYENAMSVKRNENFVPTDTNPLHNTDLTEECRITEEDYDSDEIISYKVLEEFNKVKIFVRRPKRRMSCDSYSSDSGYRSDSQRSNRSALQLSGSWLNQSGSCLFHYLLQCPLVASTRDIISEIAQVLGELIDKLHEEEKYPSFLEELLETIEVTLQQVFEGINSEENEFLKKDERIQRILLLNKSVHIQRHTIEKITNILEIFHSNITEIDSIYEIQNIDEIENVSYIFHILEILIKKYLKNKQIDSQVTTQNSQEILKKSSITDIWRKKWNPSQKKLEGSREKKCVLKELSDILNKIVVDCVSSYSLVAYSALKCFNSMQN